MRFRFVHNFIRYLNMMGCNSTSEPNKPTVVFILGGPGSGKGTQSEKIRDNYKFVHLSAGDLLREQRKTPGSQYGQIIEKNIVEGKIVPSQITVMLLENAMKKSGFEGGRFLIDGFPRNVQNMGNWQKIMKEKINFAFVLHLQCSEKLMQQRLLKRGETSGRSDDNIESIKKRFKTYQVETMEVVNCYGKDNKVENVSSENAIQDIFKEVNEIFKKHNLV